MSERRWNIRSQAPAWRQGGAGLLVADSERQPLFARAVRQARWEFRTIAGLRPSTCRAFVRRSGSPLTSDTDIVIEGFPRTGNTFAVTAFLQAQGRDLNVAHHVHAPAQLIAAVRRGVPAIALTRAPEEAVLSFVIRLPNLSVRQALRSYIRFYRPLLPYRETIVVADLTEVSSDFAAVIRRVNERFGTSFTEYQHTDENVARSLEAVDASDRSAFGEGDAFERSRARPTARRENLKEGLRDSYRRTPGSLREEAARLHRTLTSSQATKEIEP